MMFVKIIIITMLVQIALQQTNTHSKLTIQTIEEVVKYVQN